MSSTVPMGILNGTCFFAWRNVPSWGRSFAGQKLNHNNNSYEMYQSVWSLFRSVLEMASYGGTGAWEALGFFMWRFCVMFLGSAGIGVACGLLSALTLKHVALRDYTSLELCILIIFIYAPYALAEGIHLSGHDTCNMAGRRMYFSTLGDK